MAIGTAAAIAIAASAASSAYAAHKQSQAAGEAEDLQRASMDRQSGLANAMQAFGTRQMSMSEPALKAAMKYYMTLAAGNRGELNTLMAPDRARSAEMYSGASRAIMSKLTPGPQRDSAIADLTRQRVGQEALMPMQARAGAFSSLGDLGSNYAARGMQAYGTAASALSGAAQAPANIFAMQQAGQQGWQQFGNTMGQIWGPYIMGKYGSKNPKQQGPWAGGYQF